MLKGIIFDMDGVLIDSHTAHKTAWRLLNHALGREVTEEDLDFVLDGRKREEILRYFLGNLSPEKVHEYGQLKDKFFQQGSVDIKVIPGLTKFLDELQEARIKKAVATSANALRTKNMLKQLKLDRYFDVVVTGTDVVNGKPDPALFKIAAEKMGLNFSEVLVIEDAVAGVKGARSAGMCCLGLASPERATRLQEAGADEVVADFTNVSIRILQNLFAGRGYEEPSILVAANET